MPESLDRISSVLATSPRRWLDLAASLPEDLLERPAMAGEWSAVDCLRHLLQADRHVFPGRVEQFLAGHEELGVVDPATFPPVEERTAPELAEAFARVREDNLGMLAALSPGDLERTSRSRRFGPITLGDAVHQWALHDLEHLIQAERALLQSFVVQSGSLRALYRALDMEAGTVEAPSP
jgi:DinB superfamily